MKRALTVLVALVSLFVAATAAHAADHHGWIQTKPITVNGRRGFNLKLILQPQNYDTVRVGLGKMSAAGLAADRRQLAAGVAPGYLRALVAQHSGLQRGVPKEISLDIVYGDMNDLQPGERVDVLTAWGRGPYFHVHGMFDGPVVKNDATHVITLP